MGGMLSVLLQSAMLSRKDGQQQVTELVALIQRLKKAPGDLPTLGYHKAFADHKSALTSALSPFGLTFISAVYAGATWKTTLLSSFFFMFAQGGSLVFVAAKFK